MQHLLLHVCIQDGVQRLMPPQPPPPKRSTFPARLLSGDRVVVIDLGQAVDASHPRAREFLEADARNVTNFFSRKGAATLPLEDLVALVADDMLMPHPPQAFERTGSRGGHVPRPGSGVTWRGRSGGDGAEVCGTGDADEGSLDASVVAANDATTRIASSSAANEMLRNPYGDWFDGLTGPVACEIARKLQHA